MCPLSWAKQQAGSRSGDIHRQVQAGELDNRNPTNRARVSKALAVGTQAPKAREAARAVSEHLG